MKKSLEYYSEKCVFASIMKKTILTILALRRYGAFTFD